MLRAQLRLRPPEAATIHHPPLPHLCHHHWPDVRAMVHPSPNTEGKGKKDGSAAEVRQSDTFAAEQPRHHPPDRICHNPPPTTAPPLPSPGSRGTTTDSSSIAAERES
ncbi:dicer-like 3 [Striga asiatica]|uniref:Dicer-like 3 n=1 Tax=Striga asiatica TaxID=4170 RepID=A0A5A7Q154_STRAF|nr:dicer-like 3 [Striga asiatica]